MATFTDNKGRAWSVEIDTLAIRRVASRLDGLRIDRLYDDGARGMFELTGDPLRLCDLLWVLVEPEAAKRGVTDEEFGRALAGDALDAAAVAFQGALADFFPSQRRTVLAALLAKGQELQTAAVADALTAIAGIRPSKPATGAAGSSGSTPEAPA